MSATSICPWFTEPMSDLALQVSSNPFLGVTMISLMLPNKDHVYLNLYDRIVVTNTSFALEFQAEELPSEVYYLRIKTDSGMKVLTKIYYSGNSLNKLIRGS